MDVDGLLALSAFPVDDETYEAAFSAYEAELRSTRSNADRTDANARGESRRLSIFGRGGNVDRDVALGYLVLVAASDRARRQFSINHRDAFRSFAECCEWTDADDTRTQAADLAEAALSGEPHALAAFLMRAVPPSGYQTTQTFEPVGWTNVTPTANAAIGDPSLRQIVNAVEHGYRLEIPAYFETADDRWDRPGQKPTCLPPEWNTVTPSGGIVKRSNADRGARDIETCNDAVLARIREMDAARDAAEAAEFARKMKRRADRESVDGDASDCAAAIDAIADIAADGWED